MAGRTLRPCGKHALDLKPRTLGVKSFAPAVRSYLSGKSPKVGELLVLHMQHREPCPTSIREKGVRNGRGFVL
jgi:hypothetical protein